MDFWTAIVIIVAVGAGSSVVTALVNAIRPKVKEKDLERIKTEIKRELQVEQDPAVLRGGQSVGQRVERLEEQLKIHEDEIRQLSDDRSFLRRLLERKEPE